MTHRPVPQPGRTIRGIRNRFPANDERDESPAWPGLADRSVRGPRRAHTSPEHQIRLGSRLDAPYTREAAAYRAVDQFWSVLPVATAVVAFTSSEAVHIPALATPSVARA